MNIATITSRQINRMIMLAATHIKTSFFFISLFPAMYFREACWLLIAFTYASVPVASTAPVLSTILTEAAFRTDKEAILIENNRPPIITRKRHTPKIAPIPEKIYITEEELNSAYIKHSKITHSKIQKCTIKNQEETIISTKQLYRDILIDILKHTPRQILETTTLNVKKTDENGKNGYRWCDELGMSYRNRNATETLKEILKKVKLNNFTIELEIKLKPGNVIYFRTE